MVMFIVIAVALVLTVLAFVLRDNVFYSPMLHGAALLGWLTGTFLLVKAAIDGYGDPSITLAVGLFGISMAIIETVSILLPYLRERRGKTPEAMYEMRQKAYRSQIAKMTNKKPKNWWE